MTIRWLLACSLAVCCLVSISCSESDTDSEHGPKAAATEETQASKDAKKALDDAKKSLTKARDSIANAHALSSSPVPAKPATKPPSKNTASPSPSPLEDTQQTEQLEKAITTAKDELRLVESALGALQKALAAPEQQKSNQQLQAVGKLVDSTLRELDTATNALANIEEDGTLEPTKLTESLQAASGFINSKELSVLNNIVIPNDLQASPDLWHTAWEIGSWVVIIGGSILGLLLLFATGRALINSSAARADARIKSKIQPLASAIQKQQAEVTSELTALTTSQNELRTRIADLEFEIKRVAKIARDAANDGAGRRHSDPITTFNSYEAPVQKDEPVFPISINDYLSKMRSSSNIVRPDFQNDILVSDPGGTGELVLIRDAAMPDDLQPLFVIPRAAQFQTKQDFYTYYQKYYECARPSAGDVWIIDPAVVSRVAGGWQLREKGVLEVR